MVPGGLDIILQNLTGARNFSGYDCTPLFRAIRVTSYDKPPAEVQIDIFELGIGSAGGRWAPAMAIVTNDDQM